MNSPVSQCTPELLEPLLEDQLDARQVESLELHLSQCQSCRDELQQMAGPTDFWHAVESRISALSLSSTTQKSNTNQQGDSTDDEATIPSVKYLAHLLGPTDAPEFLGRLGNYEVNGLIGVGGMSMVVKAFDRSLNRFVAIKLLAPQLALNGAARKRFAREAKAAAAVAHENVLAIHAIDSWQDIPYLVMPLIRGGSLEQRLRNEGPLHTVDVLRIAHQIASGLAEAHSQGLVHRDIKPANILMNEGSERLKIADFGLARAVDDASLTQSGTIAGTPMYMSPEQARGYEVDCRSDIFSFGSLLYELCTGHPAFRAETPFGIIRRIVEEPARSIHDTNVTIPRWLCGLIETMMAKSPDRRIQTSEELVELFRLSMVHVQQPNGTPLPTQLAKFSSRGASNRSFRRIITVASIVSITAIAWRVLAIWPNANEHERKLPSSTTMLAALNPDRNDTGNLGQPPAKPSNDNASPNEREMIAGDTNDPSNKTAMPGSPPLPRKAMAYELERGDSIFYVIDMQVSRAEGEMTVEGLASSATSNCCPTKSQFYRLETCVTCLFPASSLLKKDLPLFD